MLNREKINKLLDLVLKIQKISSGFNGNPFVSLTFLGHPTSPVLYVMEDGFVDGEMFDKKIYIKCESQLDESIKYLQELLAKELCEMMDEMEDE